MLIKNIGLNAGLTIRVGDVTLTVFKLGERKARLGVSAPANMHIEMESAGGVLSPVDTSTPNVVERG